MSDDNKPSDRRKDNRSDPSQGGDVAEPIISDKPIKRTLFTSEPKMTEPSPIATSSPTPLEMHTATSGIVPHLLLSPAPTSGYSSPLRAILPALVVDRDLSTSELREYIRILTLKLGDKDLSPKTKSQTIEARDLLEKCLAGEYPNINEVIKNRLEALATHEEYREQANSTVVQLQNLLRKVKRTSQYVKYGDYLADQFRRHKSLLKPIYTDELNVQNKRPEIRLGVSKECHSWAKALRTEEKEVEALQLLGFGANWDALMSKDSHLQLFKAARLGGFELDRIKEVIYEYAGRNETVHSDITLFIKRQQWHEFGTIVSQDLKDIDVDFDLKDPQEKARSEVFRATMENLRDRFVWRPTDRASWRPRKNIAKAIDDFGLNPETHLPWLHKVAELKDDCTKEEFDSLVGQFRGAVKQADKAAKSKAKEEEKKDREAEELRQANVRIAELETDVQNLKEQLHEQAKKLSENEALLKVY